MLLNENIKNASEIDYTADNLFAGSWKLNQENIQRFDPFLQGYGFFVWTKLPAFFDADFAAQFQALTERNFKSFNGNANLTLEFEDIQSGVAGNTIPVATNLKKENTTFSIVHQEMAGSPIKEGYNHWVTGIRDPDTGLATYHGQIESGDLVYSKKNHSAELMYIVTDPSGGVGGANAIEYACYWTNVIPSSSPREHLNTESGSHSLAEITMEFRGNQYESTMVNELAATIMEEYAVRKRYGDWDPSHEDGGIGYAEES